MLDDLRSTHDLRLPSWGPYTKRYMGISHIPDLTRGLRFDLSVFPGLYRRRVDIPNVMWESGYHPWQAAPDLSYYSHRHELEWKDRVYADISFSAVNDSTRLVRCRCANTTDTAQNLVLHYMASMHFPPLQAYSNEAIRPAAVDLPAGALWIDACDYSELTPARPGPRDTQTIDGRWRGEVRRHGLVDGRGVGKAWPWEPCFGAESGDKVRWRFMLDREIRDAVLLVRYSLEGLPARFRMAGVAEGDLVLEPASTIALHRIEVGTLRSGEHDMSLTSTGDAAADIDGFAVVSAQQAPAVAFREVPWCPAPEVRGGPVPSSLLLKYQDCDACYGLRWEFPYYQIRQFRNDELDIALSGAVHNHVSNDFAGNGRGHFTNVFMRPIVLAPHSETVVDGIVCSGTAEHVEQTISSFALDRASCNSLHDRVKGRAVAYGPATGSDPYGPSQERMAATTLTNVVYPVYTRRSYIRHYTPGRNWDCLYTWDSGFIGIGLAELDIERSIDNLNAYLTEPGDPHSAFIHHGSPVPVQFYQFLEIWNRTRRPDLLEYFYPRLLQYHRFMAGRLGSSSTARFGSGLLCTWDYFYNSGGWDDYPPQKYVHDKKLEETVCPMVTTAQVIRTARIMRLAASALGRTADIDELERDIARLTRAVQDTAWDESEGYFGYVVHDRDGNPCDLLRHETGANYNRGLDGAYPLVAGVCTAEQETRLIQALRDPDRHWTHIGLSTVDKTAPYYRPDGYWNGAVWMPHQWFFWKTMLDMGDSAFAWDIARTGLDTWRREVDDSYNCFEHFIVATGRGAGWHHFSGLSTPVLSWYGAYFVPGRLTTGFDVWIESVETGVEATAIEARLVTAGRGTGELAVVVSLTPGRNYAARWNGERVKATPVRDGTLNVRIPRNARGLLTVAPSVH